MLRQRELQGIDSPTTLHVIPAFEVDGSQDLTRLPHSKAELLKLVRQGKARQIHQEKCWVAHSATDYERWYAASDGYDVEYQVSRVCYVPVCYVVWCGVV